MVSIRHTIDEIPQDDKVHVCAECGQASCWLGIFMCSESGTADIKEATVAELREQALENTDYIVAIWEQEYD